MVIFTAVLTCGCVCFGILQVDFFSSFMIIVQWKSKTHHISSSPPAPPAQVQSYEGGTQVQSEGAEKFDVG